MILFHDDDDSHVGSNGYTGVYANGEGNKGVAQCPFGVLSHVGNEPIVSAANNGGEGDSRDDRRLCCPVAGIPAREDTWISRSYQRTEFEVIVLQLFR